MIANDIIAESQLNFGETTALTLTAADWQRWVNTALKELYSLLPRPELEVLAQTAPVTLTAGKGSLPADLDHLLGVEVSGLPAIEVPPVSIEIIDGNTYLLPSRAVWATDGEHLWVRKALSTPTTATVTYIAPPAPVTVWTAEVVLPKWHPALVLFTTAFAYAQEEDKGQAQHYRNEALALINRTATAPEQEALA